MMKNCIYIDDNFLLHNISVELSFLLAIEVELKNENVLEQLYLY